MFWVYIYFNLNSNQIVFNLLNRYEDHPNIDKEKEDKDSTDENKTSAKKAQ